MSTETTASTKQSGKYLSFALGKEEYGLEILKVREIIRYMDVTPVPRTPAYVEGVINLRGQVIPVINLRRKFGMEDGKCTEETCIIVVEIQQNGRKLNTGIVVDRVTEVLPINGEQVDDAPSFDGSVSTEFILGIARVGKTVKILLDIDHVLNTEDLVALRDVHKAAA